MCMCMCSCSSGPKKPRKESVAVVPPNKSNPKADTKAETMMVYACLECSPPCVVAMGLDKCVDTGTLSCFRDMHSKAKWYRSSTIGAKHMGEALGVSSDWYDVNPLECQEMGSCTDPCGAPAKYLLRSKKAGIDMPLCARCFRGAKSGDSPSGLVIPEDSAVIKL